MNSLDVKNRTKNSPDRPLDEPKVAVITGASSGIGLETAKKLYECGYSIVMGARRLAKLQQLSQHITSHGGQNDAAKRILCLELDVTHSASVQNFVEGTFNAFGSIDVLVNNAGLAIGLDPVAEGKESDWHMMLETNVMGALRVVRGFLPAMLKQQRGHIINMGSVAGFSVYNGGAVYSATKHALLAITKTLRLELNGTPIRVTSIDPGMVETGFSEVRLGDAEKAKNVYKGMTPLTGEDIADCVAFCVTRKSHVNIDQIIIQPTDQASVHKVHRRS